jgi:hypothetical protein
MRLKFTLALFTGLFVASSTLMADDGAAVTVLPGNPNPNPVCLGSPVSVSFSGTLTDPSNSTCEITITNTIWNWTASDETGQVASNSNGGASWTFPWIPANCGNETVTASATVTFQGTNCNGGYSTTASGSASVAVQAIHVVSIDGPTAGSLNPPPFAGGQEWTFDVTHSPHPDKHVVVFYKDCIYSSFNIKDGLQVKFQANICPNITSQDINNSEKWSKISGSDSGSLDGPSSFTFMCDTPSLGGVYRFNFDLGLCSDCVCSTNGATLVLPLAGAEVDAIVKADIVRADSFAVYVNAHYYWWQKRTHALIWFNNNGAGDYLGRPDNASYPTVWAYNQVSSDGFGAVATWKGIPIKIAKMSNFIVAYAARKIGVRSTEAWIANFLIGHGNDVSATESWNAGWDVAAGSSYDSTVATMVKYVWDKSDGKNEKLWPNYPPVDNYVAPDSWGDPDHQFTSPGFLYMTNP